MVTNNRVRVGILVLLCAVVFSCFAPLSYADMKKLNREDEVFECLCRQTDNKALIAGVMGYFSRESMFKPNAVAGWDVRNLGQEEDICVLFTRVIDEGLRDGSTREPFVMLIHDKFGGYGLGQWVSEAYLEGLYDYARSKGASIGDIETQCEFFFKSMSENKELMESIDGLTDARKVGRRIGYMYDGDDCGGAEIIADLSKAYYEQYFLK